MRFRLSIAFKAFWNLESTSVMTMNYSTYFVRDSHTLRTNLQLFVCGQIPMMGQLTGFHVPFVSGCFVPKHLVSSDVFES